MSMGTPTLYLPVTAWTELQTSRGTNLTSVSCLSWLAGCLHLLRKSLRGWGRAHHHLSTQWVVGAGGGSTLSRCCAMPRGPHWLLAATSFLVCLHSFSLTADPSVYMESSEGSQHFCGPGRNLTGLWRKQTATPAPGWALWTAESSVS